MIHWHMSYETEKNDHILEAIWDCWMLNRASPSFWKGTNHLPEKQHECSRTEWNGEAEKTRGDKTKRGWYIRKSLVIELESSDGERVLGCVIIENLLCIQASHSRENPSCSARNKHCLRKHLQILLSLLFCLIDSTEWMLKQTSEICTYGLL